MCETWIATTTKKRPLNATRHLTCWPAIADMKNNVRLRQSWLKGMEGNAL
jgi:hypothetical protein